MSSNDRAVPWRVVFLRDDTGHGLEHVGLAQVSSMKTGVGIISADNASNASARATSRRSCSLGSTLFLKLMPLMKKRDNIPVSTRTPCSASSRAAKTAA